MATTQYIGARYVPLFYTAPDNSNDWTAGVAYDPLTIVTYLNQSYTSKIPVPATVGNPADNPTYWILTGNYSAQVAQYKQEVDNYAQTAQTLAAQLQSALQNLSDVRKRKFILLGDSYGYGIDGDNNTQFVTGGGWIQRTISYFNNAGIDAYYATAHLQGVVGFASSLPFATMLQSCITNDVPDADEITDIVVLGGTNDVGFGSNITTAIASFVSLAHALCPNAIIHIGCIGVNVKNLRSSVLPYYKDCMKYGCDWINDTTNMLGAYLYVGADGIHLTKTGYAYFAPYIACAILTGRVNYKFIYVADATALTGFSLGGNLHLNISVMPNGYEILISSSSGNQSIYWDSGTSPSAYGSNAQVATYGSLPNLPLDYEVFASGSILAYDAGNLVEYPYLHARICFIGHFLAIYWGSGDFVLSNTYRYKFEVPYEPTFIATN